MTPLTDLLAPAVALTWREAVGVVIELVRLTEDDSSHRAPSLAASALTPWGEVVAGQFERLDGPPVRHLAGVLDALVAQAACPGELRLLATRNLQEPASHPTLEEFAQTLAAFDGPDRRDVLRQLAARLGQLETAAQARAAFELERLTARARLEPDEAAESPRPRTAPAPDPYSSPKMRTKALLATAALVIGFGGTIVIRDTDVARLPSRLSGGYTPKAATVEAQELPRGGTALAPAPHAAPAEPDAPAPPPDRRQGTAGRLVAPPPRPHVEPLPAPIPPHTRGFRAPPPPESVSEDLKVRTIYMEVTDLGEAVVLPDASPAAAVVAPPGDRSAAARLYSLGDSGVHPPVLVRPALPTEPPPDVRPEDVGVFDIVVNERGDVEQVRLLSPANRYRERMLVAAAKAWKFRPASKDGTAVRFRTRVRITL
jgi:hypothetical protein